MKEKQEMIALMKIRIDGEKIAVNDPFQSSDLSLIECGAAVLVDSSIESTAEKEAAEKTTPASSAKTSSTDKGTVDEAEARAAKLKATLMHMLETDPTQQSETLWTSKGMPSIKAVENHSKLDTNRDEVDPIWQTVKPD